MNKVIAAIVAALFTLTAVAPVIAADKKDEKSMDKKDTKKK